MAAATHEQPLEAVADADGFVPYRLRKPAQFFPALTMLDAQQLVEQLGQRERVLRIAHAARELEANGERCDTLAALAVRAELTCTQSKDAMQEKVARLRRAIKEASELAAELGAEVDEPGMRSVCFAFSGCCQRTAAELRRQQLWRGGR